MESSICWLYVSIGYQVSCSNKWYYAEWQDIHKKRPSTGPLQQDHFLPSHFYTPFSLMFIFQNVHCYHNLFILLVLVRHTPFLHRCKLSRTRSAEVPTSHSKKTPLNATRGYTILQWTVVTFLYLSACSRSSLQKHTIKRGQRLECGEIKRHEVTITTSLILGFFP